MIRYNIIRFFVSFFFLVGAGCQDELAERYEYPDNGSEPTIGEFFTAMLHNDRVRPSYWNMSTFINWHIGVYSQSVGYINGPSMYQQNEAYIQERWDDFYRPSVNGSGVMAVYREVEKAYEKLPEKNKADQAIFLNAARIVWCDQTAQMVDLWGDIPFNEAGSLNAKGEPVYPRFDDAEEIYRTLIAELEAASLYFGVTNWTNSALTAFAQQDVLLVGNTRRWQEYANSIRLRLLMRMSFFDEPFARQEVLKMLNSPAMYPLLETEDYVPGKDDVLLHPLTTHIYDLHEAFNDWTNYPAPYYALEEVLKPADDLRIPVLFDKYGRREADKFIQNEEYNALPITLETNQQKESLGNYAVVDSVTFLFNAKLPGVVITSSEVSFLIAEARERWGGGDPENFYRRGIANSIKFYYYLNSLNVIRPTGLHLPSPTSQEIENFLDASEPVQYAGTRRDKLVKIWRQKWVHLGILQAQECWAELRRTGHPDLRFHPAPLSGFEYPPNRLTYPSNEKTYNDNYRNVSAKDRRDVKIFWQYR